MVWDFSWSTGLPVLCVQHILDRNLFHSGLPLLQYHCCLTHLWLVTQTSLRKMQDDQSPVMKVSLMWKREDWRKNSFNRLISAGSIVAVILTPLLHRCPSCSISRVPLLREHLKKNPPKVQPFSTNQVFFSNFPIHLRTEGGINSVVHSVAPLKL